MDPVNPPHYKQYPIECIEFAEKLNFCLGNAFKYLWRQKVPADIDKAIYYLKRSLKDPLFSAKLYIRRKSGMVQRFAELQDYMDKDKLMMVFDVFSGDRNSIRELISTLEEISKCQKSKA